MGSDTFSINLYDQLNAQGNLLGVGTATLNVVAGAANSIDATYDGVLDHVTAVPAATSIPAGTAAADSVAINGYDPDSNLIVGPNPYIDANGSPVTLTLAVSNTAAGGKGAMQLSQTSVTAPATVSLTYNGLAMYGATLTIQASPQVSGALTGATVAVTPTIKEYGVSPYDPGSLVTGPDGNVWFGALAAVSQYSVVKITPSGSVTNYPVGSGTTSSVGSLIVGPDQNIWYADYEGIGNITTAAGQVTLYSPFAAVGYGVVNSITVGPGNQIWASLASETVAKVSTDYTTSSGSYLTDYAYPSGLTAGPNGGLMFVEGTASNIGFATSAGSLSEVPTADGVSAGGITLGPDGNIWYTQTAHVVKASTSGTVLSEYPISAAGGGIITGPDGNLWFAEYKGNAIGRVTPQGTVTEFPVPTAYAPQAEPALTGLTVGPDGNIWFCEFVNQKIGVLIY